MSNTPEKKYQYLLAKTEVSAARAELMLLLSSVNQEGSERNIKDAGARYKAALDKFLLAVSNLADARGRRIIPPAKSTHRTLHRPRSICL